MDLLRYMVFKARTTFLRLQMAPHEKQIHLLEVKNKNGLDILKPFMLEHKQFLVKNDPLILYVLTLAQSFEVLL